MQPDDDKTRTHIVLTKGTMVSHYRIVEKIGAGGMGEVYLAEDTELDRKVALKFLPSHLCQDEECRRRFKREAQAAAKLSHPNIVTIHEVGEYQGRPFFAMEHVEGQSLRDRLKERELDSEEVIELALQIGDGLNKAHQAGITHRDVKPSNIEIDADGRPKLLDFGLASVVGVDQLTKTGSTLGTVGYMSPEQVQGKEVDQRSDLFSLGVVLYEMITGRPPFKGDTEAAVMNAVLNDTVEPLSRYKSDVPDELQNIVSKLLERDRELRYQTAAGVVSDLKRLRRDSDTSMVSQAPTAPRGRTARYLIPALIVVVAVAALVFKPWQLEVRSTHEALANGNRLAIMYFNNMADPADSQRLGEIATNLLITDLSESRYVQVVSSQRLYDILKNMGREGEKRIDPGVASQIAEKAKAKWMLQGNILQTEPEMVLTAHLIEVSSGNTVASQRITGSPDESIFALVDKLTVEIKKDLSLPEAALNEPDRPVATVTTRSPEAYRLYLEGVELGFQRYEADAERALKKAVEIDSTFAMAYYRLGGLTSGAERRRMAAKALEFAGNASHYERLLIEAFNAYVNGDARAAIAKGREVLSRYPADKEMYYVMGHLYRFGLRQVDSATYYFTKAVELDSLYEAVYNSLAYCYNDLGDFERSIWAINKYIELAPDLANPYDTRGELYAAHGKLDEAIASFEKAIEIKPDFYGSWENLGFMHTFRRNYAEARRCFEKLLGSSRPSTRSEARQLLAVLLVHAGRLREALTLIDQGIATDRMEKVETWSKQFQAARIHAEIGSVDEALAVMEEAMANYAENRGAFVPMRSYYIQILADNGRLARVEKELSEWRKLIAPDDSGSLAFWWLGAGCLERAKGNHGAAIEHFTTAAHWFVNPVYVYGFHTHVMLARTLQEAGQLGDAVDIYERLLSIYGQARIKSTLLGVKLHYFLGTAYEESGWNDKAIEQYETFLDIWKDADPGLAAVEDARQRLARLKTTP